MAPGGHVELVRAGRGVGADQVGEERVQRHRALMKVVSDEDIGHWRTTFMDALGSVEDSGVTGGSIHAEHNTTHTGSAG